MNIKTISSAYFVPIVSNFDGQEFTNWINFALVKSVLFHPDFCKLYYIDGRMQAFSGIEVEQIKKALQEIRDLSKN